MRSPLTTACYIHTNNRSYWDCLFFLITFLWAAQEIGLAPQQTLSKLVNGGFIEQVEPNRYRLFESVRQFSLTKLMADPKFQREAERRFCSFFAAWAEQSRRIQEGGSAPHLFTTFFHEQANLLRACKLSQKLGYTSAEQRLKWLLGNLG